MDGTNGITPVMPVNGMGDGSFMWIFGLLILLGLFNGGGFGFGGNNVGTASLDASMQRGFDTQNLQAQTRDILSAVTNGTAQTIAASTQNAANAITAIKDGNASLIREFGNVENAIAGIAGEMQNCCCNTLRAIDGVNYNTTVQIQKVLDAIAGNRMADMQNQINALQLQNAMSGVLRFPSAWTYAGGVFPPVSGTTAA
jgi:hypothetical protein